MFSVQDEAKAQELLETIRFFSQRNWSPATSTNYSVRSHVPGKAIISRSGVDKSRFTLQDLILIDMDGTVEPAFQGPGIKSSAETEIHTSLYQRFPDVNCVLRTHSVLGTTLSLTFQKEKGIFFDGYEILKGLEGNTTHEMSTKLPVVPNSQEMAKILHNMDSHFKTPIHGFLIAGHGLYTWGKDIATAKRHVETFEFLFECHQASRR